jgi:hypothetical protein
MSSLRSCTAQSFPSPQSSWHLPPWREKAVWRLERSLPPEVAAIAESSIGQSNEMRIYAIHEQGPSGFDLGRSELIRRRQCRLSSTRWAPIPSRRWPMRATELRRCSIPLPRAPTWSCPPGASSSSAVRPAICVCGTRRWRLYLRQKMYCFLVSEGKVMCRIEKREFSDVVVDDFSLKVPAF